MFRKINQIVLYSLCIALFSINIYSVEKSSDQVWQIIEKPSSESKLKQRSFIPNSYKTIRLNKSILQTILSSVPNEQFTIGEKSEVILTLPLPNGKFERFAIKESPIMEAVLAAEFPEIKTYLGQGIDNPTATTRFDITPKGFHAIILSDQGTFYIDPFTKEDTVNYISFRKSDVGVNKPFVCLFEGNEKLNTFQTLDDKSYSDVSNIVTNAGTLRTYRLAVAATGEYTSAAGGGTVAGAMAAMVTTMNRVNGIYERELSIRMSFVANNNSIIYTNGGTDPYSNNSGFTMLGQNQSNVDAVIGDANYDIGHVFSTGGGGVASLRSPCRTGRKARGVTGLPNPTGDVFDVDFVSHEMGHQWGGNHTFNGSTGNCSGGNRNGSTAHEPGSGTTIQAYAGICSPQNVQSNSNDYFHVLSLEEMVAFSTTGLGTCSANTPNGNTAPTLSVVGGPTFNIPRNTPFTLTATGNDVDGDTVTYTWEEYSLGAQAAPSSTADAPMVRSYAPTTSPIRTIPSLTYILNNDNVAPTTYTGTSATGAVCNFGNCLSAEFLSSITRTMPFQVTARDNRAGGGGIRSAQATVNVTNTSGPFKVTAQDSLFAPDWQTGDMQTVTWNVANTTNAPVSAASVDITLSTDGGMTFPHVLATNTPNDGTQQILVPNGTVTNQARIKVQGNGNIFFDINNVNFNIVLGPTSALASVNGQVITKNGRGISRTLVKLVNTGNGEIVYGTSNQFGYFNFYDLQVGETYTISVSHRRYEFSTNTQVFDLEENLKGLNFVGSRK